MGEQASRMGMHGKKRYGAYQAFFAIGSRAHRWTRGGILVSPIIRL